MPRPSEPLDDEAPIGRILTRREALALFGATAGSAFLAACVPSVLLSPGAATPSPSGSGTATLPSCVVRPELTEGPYFASKGARDTRNGDDGIYRGSGGQMTLAPRQSGDGYAAAFEIGVVAA